MLREPPRAGQSRPQAEQAAASLADIRPCIHDKVRTFQADRRSAHTRVGAFVSQIETQDALREPDLQSR